jgi:hypothetical protein
MSWDPWPGDSWQKHLLLSNQSRHYFFEGEWDVYEPDGEPYTLIFNHRATGIQFKQTFTPKQFSTICYGSKLIRTLDFINWMGDL